MTDLRMTHFVSIAQGRIELRFAGDPMNAPAAVFITEEAAAEAMAQAIVRTTQSAAHNSSSVFHPEENGRPDFDVNRFGHLVRSTLKAVRAGAAVPPHEVYTVVNNNPYEVLHRLAFTFPDAKVMIEHERIVHTDDGEGGQIANSVYDWHPATLVTLGHDDHGRMPHPDNRIISVGGPHQMTLARLNHALQAQQRENPNGPLLIAYVDPKDEADFDPAVYLERITIEHGLVYLDGGRDADIVEVLPHKPIALLKVGDLIQGKNGWEFGQRYDDHVWVSDDPAQQKRAVFEALTVHGAATQRLAFMQGGLGALLTINRECDAYDEARPGAKFGVTSVLLYRDGKHVHADPSRGKNDKDVLVVEATRLTPEGKFDMRGETIRFIHDGVGDGRSYAMRASAEVVGSMKLDWE